ncbi:MAG: hypothetical protein ACRDRJ_44945 [Streptosporangiaceae bacterium]
MPLTLADLTCRTGLDVLDHVEREAAIHVTGRLQAQGDLIVIPFAWLDGQVEFWPGARWQPVPAAGLVLLRSAAGGNPHTLVADPGRCEWTTSVADPTGLGLGALTAACVAYLLHPEHGGAGIAPGTYLVRRQREGTDRVRGRDGRLIAD